MISTDLHNHWGRIGVLAKKKIVQGRHVILLFSYDDAEMRADSKNVISILVACFYCVKMVFLVFYSLNTLCDKRTVWIEHYMTGHHACIKNYVIVYTVEDCTLQPLLHHVAHIW